MRTEILKPVFFSRFRFHSALLTGFIIRFDRHCVFEISDFRCMRAVTIENDVRPYSKYTFIKKLLLLQEQRSLLSLLRIYKIAQAIQNINYYGRATFCENKNNRAKKKKTKEKVILMITRRNLGVASGRPKNFEGKLCVNKWLLVANTRLHVFIIYEKKKNSSSVLNSWGCGTLKEREYEEDEKIKMRFSTLTWVSLNAR